MSREEAQAVVDEIFSLYEQFGAADYIGEPVSQIEHMCQAAQLAEREGYDEDVVLAAFFHDIGHLCEHVYVTESMDGYGIVDHEGLGARFLREKGFSDKIAKLVESHVAAKRYLTLRNPDYYNRLSEASKNTLALQGGVMSEEEAKYFEEDHLHLLFIKVREWDDKAKVEHIPLPSLEIYRQMALHHLLKQN